MAKRKDTSGSHREAESSDASDRGGPPRSSDEAGVMLVERRGAGHCSRSGPTGAIWQWEEPHLSTEGGSLLVVARAG